MSIVEKAYYLMETKNKLKNIINEKGGTITDSTPFRSYENQIKSFQLSGETITIEPQLLLTAGQQCSGSSNKPIGVEPTFKSENCDEYITFDTTTAIFTVNKPCKLIFTVDMLGISSTYSGNPNGVIYVNEVVHTRPSVVGGNNHSLTNVFIDGQVGTTFRFNRSNTSGYLTLYVKVYLIDDAVYDGLKILNETFATR